MRRLGYRLCLVLLGLAASARPAGALDATGCQASPEVRERVGAALRREGLEGASIQGLPCGVMANVPQLAQLELMRVWKDPVLHSAHARFRCHAPARCLPFLVTLENGVDGRTNIAEQIPAVASIPPRIPVRQTRSSEAPLVRSGQRVLLLWEHGPLRLTRAMVSLDSGRAGDQVRTRARDGGPVVNAQVISAGWVRVRE